MFSRTPRIAAILLALLFVLASTPSAAAEPGKDPNGHSSEAPGQQKDKEHGYDKNREPENDASQPDPQPHEAAVDWHLNLVVNDVQGINDEAIRMVREHLEAGIPVTVEPGENLSVLTPPDLGPLMDLLDPAAILPSPSGLGTPDEGGAESQAMSDEDCLILILGTMDEPPYLDPGIRPECIPDPEIPLGNLMEKLPGDDDAPDLGKFGITLIRQ